MTQQDPQQAEQAKEANTRKTLSLVSGALSVLFSAVSWVWGLVQGSLLYRTSQFTTINEGNEGCIWFFLAAPSLLIGFGLGGITMAGSLLAVALAARARSWPALALAAFAVLSSAALLLLDIYGEHLLFE